VGYELPALVWKAKKVVNHGLTMSVYAKILEKQFILRPEKWFVKIRCGSKLTAKSVISTFSHLES
jgi:hypothetical protein